MAQLRHSNCADDVRLELCALQPIFGTMSMLNTAVGGDERARMVMHVSKGCVCVSCFFLCVGSQDNTHVDWSLKTGAQL